MWIDFYKSLDRSYNLRGGGDKNLVSEETKRRMKIAQNTPELLSLRSKTHKGLEKSKEHKRKISEGNTKTKGKFILVVNRLTGEIFEVFGINEAVNLTGMSRSGVEGHLYNGNIGRKYQCSFKQ